MFNVGTGEMLVILVLALIVLGPDKLPEAARKAGHFLSEFRRMSSGFQQEFRDAMDLQPSRPGSDTPEARANNGTGNFSLPASGATAGSALDEGAAVATAETATPPPPVNTVPIEVDGPSGSFS